MAVLRRLRWVKATLGSKPGSRAVLDTLLAADDLPGGGWEQRDERTWRTGEAGPETSWAIRARDVGSVTAWRSFERRDGSQGLWCQLTPLASPEDAASALVDLPSRMLANLRADVEVVASRAVAPPVVPGAEHVWAQEQTTLGSRGEGVVRFLAATVGEQLFAVCAAGDEGWAWPGIIGLAQVQAARIKGRTRESEA